MLPAIRDRRSQSADLIDVFARRADSLSEDMLTGEITLGDWQLGMRELLRDSYKLQVVAAAGGDKSKVDGSDWLALGPQLKEQYGYLEDFAHAVGDALQDPESDASQALFQRVQSRARMYVNSSREAFWTMAAGDVDLPAYPGDGSTKCLVNCQCEWTFALEQDADGQVTAVLATWTLGEAEHCPDCIARSETWSPYRVEVGEEDRLPLGVA